MLQETARRVQEEGVSTKALTLCRADVAALPLRPASIDAMHAGAAMHCWPRLEEGLKQIRQVLRPGGLFYATTFLQGAYGSGMPLQTGGSSFRFFRDADELRQLLVRAGEHAEFVEGALVVNSSVRVRKKGANKLLLEGSYGPDYLLVRSMLYSQVEAV